MVISATDGLDGRIAVLEKKMQDLEPLVKGLIAELLDFKAFAMTVAREEGERSRQEMKQGPAVYATPAPSVVVHNDGTTVIRPKGAAQPAAPAEPEMVRIMQTDGTMKMEPRYGGAINNSTVGYGRTKKGTFDKSKQAPMIYAADKEDADSKKK